MTERNSTGRSLRSFSTWEDFRLLSEAVPAVLVSFSEKAREATLNQVNERNNEYFKEEITKLELWADDLKATLEMEIKDLDRKIREVRKASHTALTLEEKACRAERDQGA